MSVVLRLIENSGRLFQVIDKGGHIQQNHMHTCYIITIDLKTENKNSWLIN